jgi:hypothetical protein
MVLKGRIEGPDDYRKYFIRLYLKDKNTLDFGHTWDKDLIKEKFSRILILVKGISMPFSNKENYRIKDESEYIDYIY